MDAESSRIRSRYHSTTIHFSEQHTGRLFTKLYHRYDELLDIMDPVVLKQLQLQTNVYICYCSKCVIVVKLHTMGCTTHAFILNDGDKL